MLQLRIGVSLIIVSILACFSSPVLSWGQYLQTQLLHISGNAHTAHILTRILSLCGLIIACLLLPRITSLEITGSNKRIQHHAYARFLAIGAGLLLVIEPLIVIIILSYGGLFTDVNFLALITPGRMTGDASLINILYFFLFIIFTPICEEWFFRGRLFNWIQKHFDPISCVSISTLAFAVAHANVLQSLIAIPLGLLLGYLRLQGASLRICMTIHAAHNLLFFTLGGFFIIQPTVTILCCIGGCWLLATGCAWKGPIHLPRRVLILTLSGTLIAAALSPIYIRCCDFLWAQAVYRQINNPQQYHQHLILCLRRSHIRNRAIAQLLQRFDQQPLADSDRQFWVDILFRSELILEKCQDDEYAYQSLKHISTYPDTLQEFQIFAHQVAIVNPNAFIEFVSHAPLALPLWFNRGSSPHLSQLLNHHYKIRRSLLRAMLRSYNKKDCLYSLLRIQAEHIHPRDLMFIRGEYEKEMIQELLDDLQKENDALAQQWMQKLNG
ncbi:MAG: CPBP family intramembrane metalloprotease [Planctomycetes bacterium]|nr:CPBP family intramembrane metalloprotease [Planctomycetota bacterium]